MDRSEVKDTTDRTTDEIKAIAVPYKKRRRRLTVLNQLADFNRLITTLADFGLPVRVAFEATGNYHRALAYRLGVAGFDVKLVSSVALARIGNVGRGDDCEDQVGVLHSEEVDQADLPGAAGITEHGAEGFAVRGNRV